MYHGTDELECVYVVCFNVCIDKQATLTSLNVFATCDGSLVIELTCVWSIDMGR